MRRVAAAALLFAVGCLGPKLELPQEPKGIHAWLCATRACPIEAAKVGGTVQKVAYWLGLCDCHLIDARGLPVWERVPPHPPHGGH